MSQVDFYLLQTSDISDQQLACRLALMAWERGHRVLVIAASDEDAATLDELMWRYPEQRFVPHQLGDHKHATKSPVCIGGWEHGSDRDLAINMTTESAPNPEQFKRLLEIVPNNEVERTASREKFKVYRHKGLNPATHKIEK